MKADYSKNYYEILEINNISTVDDIKLSYRKLSKVWHPDISKLENNKEKFKEIVEAYEILSNKSDKDLYDLKSPWGKDWREEHQHLDFEFSNQGKEFDDFKSVINKTKDDRIHIIIVIDEFKEDITFERLLLCNTCDGSGKDSSNLNDCPICKGDGENSRGDKCFMCDGLGKIENMECEMCNNTGTFMNVVCRLCKGQGNISLSSCKKCEGGGRHKVNQTIKIKIDDFVENILVIKGSGHASKLNIGIMGDLCIKIKKDN